MDIKKVAAKVSATAVHKHEAHDHPGEKPTKLKRGGRAKKTK